jgi:hypothetical protein
MKKKFIVTHTTRETAILRITKHLGYKDTFCQNVVSTQNNRLYLYFRKTMTWLNIGLLRRICQIVLSPVELYTDCCFMTDM